MNYDSKVKSPSPSLVESEGLRGRWLVGQGGHVGQARSEAEVVGASHAGQPRLAAEVPVDDGGAHGRTADVARDVLGGDDRRRRGLEPGRARHRAGDVCGGDDVRLCMVHRHLVGALDTFHGLDFLADPISHLAGSDHHEIGVALGEGVVTTDVVHHLHPIELGDLFPQAEWHVALGADEHHDCVHWFLSVRLTTWVSSEKNKYINTTTLKCQYSLLSLVRFLFAQV